MEIKAIPLKSVNGIKFGMKREEVRKLLGEYEEFKKSVLSTNTTDDFGYCHVYYNKNKSYDGKTVNNAPSPVSPRPHRFVFFWKVPYFFSFLSTHNTLHKVIYYTIIHHL